MVSTAMVRRARPGGILAIVALLLIGFGRPAGAAQALAAEPAPMISLVTFGPGELYWERFGHNAILVGAPADPDAVLYNYGVFDFGQPDFVLNFVRGHMQYRLAEQTFGDALRLYASEHRSIYLQQLDLEPQQRRDVAAFLAWNAAPEHAQYQYDYFLANCSTRVRDVLDRASAGALSRLGKGLVAGSSYRAEATRLIAPAWPLALAMDLGMGPRADAPIDLWQQSFVPMVLKDLVGRAQLQDAGGAQRPLVADATWLFRSDTWAEPERAPRWAPALATIGTLFAVVLLVLDRLRATRVARWSFAVLAVTAGLTSVLGGVVLLAGGAWTEHWVMAANRNVLLLDPLCLLLLPAWVLSAAEGWRPTRWQCALSLLVAALAALSLPLTLLPGAQQNLSWIGLLLPMQLAFAAVMWRAATRPRSR